MVFWQFSRQFLLGSALILALLAFFALWTSTTDLEDIQDSGKLTVVTIKNPVTIYEDQQGATGFEYELVKAFADYLKVDIEIITVSSKTELVDALKSGQAQLAAANLTINAYHQNFVDFAAPYETITETVVYRYGTKRPRKPQDLIGSNLMVVTNSNHAHQLKILKENYPDLQWTESYALADEGLLSLLQQGAIDYTIVDSNVFDMYRSLFPDLTAGMSISESMPLAWAMAKNNDGTLKAASADFLNRMTLEGNIEKLKNEFYADVEEFNYVQSKAFLAHMESRLPKYVEYFQAAATKFNIDWRLLAAMSYQESHWNPKAISPTGVKGMMMLTKPTARELGIEDRVNAEDSINGGAQYLKKLLRKIPEDIQEPDRTWIALAAYNVGFGHVTDAKLLTEQQGDDPAKWENIKTRLPLLKSREFFADTRYGYARGGGQSVIYVNHIRRYYNALVWATSSEHISDHLLAYNNRN